MNDYASNTNGLPKTDFQAMRDIAASVFEEPLRTEEVTQRGGIAVGQSVLKMCEKLEAMMASHNYNAFATPSSKSFLGQIITDSMNLLSLVYLIRLNLRKHDLLPSEDELANNYVPILPSSTELIGMAGGLVSLAEHKDREYGASWCKRGGIGAWFTTTRKFDRLVTQLKAKNENIWDISDGVESTESLEETIKDAINYLLLISEKRSVIARGV